RTVNITVPVLAAFSLRWVMYCARRPEPPRTVYFTSCILTVGSQMVLARIVLVLFTAPRAATDSGLDGVRGRRGQYVFWVIRENLFLPYPSENLSEKVLIFPFDLI